MTFESGSYDAAFAAEATRKYGTFKKKGRKKERLRWARKASPSDAGTVFFFFSSGSDRASKTQIAVSDSQPFRELCVSYESAVI